MNDVLTINVAEHAYDITVRPGAMAAAGTLIAPLAPTRVFVLTDEHCAQHYLMPLISALRAASLDIGTPIVVPPGEGTKSFQYFEKVTRELLQGGVDRNSILIALGGGVIGDLAGFAAATVLRGIRYVQIPTTLLAQVDSSVGGKTGINAPEGKNLVGAFHQPSLVIIDPQVLKTLPQRELLAGYVEIYKMGLILDEPFAAWCEAHANALLALDETTLQQAIYTAVKHKADVVMQDPIERTGTRALLNLGHTFGHAYEALCKYSGELLHGEAVALGLVKAAELSAHLGHADAALIRRIEMHLGHVGLPIDPKFYGQFTADEILARMRGDKKNNRGELNFILLKGAGEAFVAKNIAEADVRAIL
jgi:3-dehydroquinate synthase